MKHRVGLRYPPARAILQDLTYSPSVVRDIIYQPLISLDEKSYVTAPLLLYGSSHERNFLLSVNKINAASAQAINATKEPRMIEELQPLFEALGLHVKPRLRLGRPPNVIGDIDVLVWDREAVFALAISLKWFYGPDSVYEVREHDSKFRKALDDQRRCLEELDARKVELSTNFALVPALKRETTIRGAIVSKVARPTELVMDAEIPVVTSDELVSCLKDSDLSALYHELRRISESAPPINGQDSHNEIWFGGYLIRFPQFTLQE
jgi:hypothetical protein